MLTTTSTSDAPTEARRSPRSGVPGVDRPAEPAEPATRRRDRGAARAPPQGGSLRGRAPPGELSASARRRLRRPRAAERGRRPCRRPGEARRLPRRQPLHHLGVQVRAVRGGHEDPPPRLAGTRAAARARELVAASPKAGRAHTRMRKPRSSSPPCRTRSGLSSAPTSARSSSRSRSTTSRSTSWPNGSTRPAARCTRPSTTLGTSSDGRWPPAASALVPTRKPPHDRTRHSSSESSARPVRS